MEIPLIVSAIAATIALLRGGSLTRLASTRFAGVSLLAISLAVQVFFVAYPPAWLTRQSALAILLGAQAAVVVFLVLNRKLPGVALVAAGLFLNMLVIGINQAMPVSAVAAEIAGAEYLSDQRHVEHGLHLRAEPLDDDTALPFLADIIPLPFFAQVVSFGDVLLTAGIAWLVYARTREKTVGIEAVLGEEAVVAGDA